MILMIINFKMEDTISISRLIEKSDYSNHNLSKIQTTHKN
jgi:hypothetical protein